MLTNNIKTPLLIDLTNYLNDYYKNKALWNIDTIRVEFSKQHKLHPLKKLGKWTKITQSSKISTKLKNRLKKKEFIKAYRLDDKNIFYGNVQDKQSRKAILEIFAIHQYNQNGSLKKYDFDEVDKILAILKNITSIDICFDTMDKPNIDNLKSKLKTKEFMTTHYINEPDILTVDKICIYDKEAKNELHIPLYRVEATLAIPNSKDLYLPLDELGRVLELLEIKDKKFTPRIV
jgi:hypothetical protein